jgi:hypothetical protein
LTSELTTIRDDVVDKPDVRFVQLRLVSIDLLLPVSPIGQLADVGPERYLGRHVNEPKMSGLASERLSFMCIVHLNLEQGIVVSGGIVDGPGGEFLVGRHERRSDIVRQQVGLRVDVEKLDDIVMTDDTASSAVGDLPGRNDLPVVVGIVVRVTGDLLTCISGKRARHHINVLRKDAEGV